MKGATKMKLDLAWVAAIAAAIALLPHSTLAQTPPSLKSDGDDCYWIFRSQGEGVLRSILLNRCTGHTWILQIGRTPDGKDVMRWFPLRPESNEYTFSTTQPNR
jgi:hypothetical protein